MYAVAYRLTGSSADAHDVLHEVFVQLPKTLRSFDRKRPLGAWLRAVTARVALVQLRSQRRRREVSISHELVDEARSGPPVLDSIMLERALSSLPEELRTVILLKALAGYSHKEIGQLLGVPDSTSRGRLYTARKLLRAALSEQ